MPKGDALESIPGLGAVWRTATRPVGSVRAVRTTEPLVVLTYDDGPLAGQTEGVLASLSDTGSTATFFVLMTKVRRAPGLLREVVAAGHEVALHGPDHRRLVGLPVKEVTERTRAARFELEDLLGAPVRWIRPPYGSQTPPTWAAVRRAGLTPVMWGGTTWDWKDIPTQDRLARAIPHLVPGQILLAHDALAGLEDGAEDRPSFDLDRGAFARELLGAIDAHGYRAVSLVDALARGARLRTWAWFGR